MSEAFVTLFFILNKISILVILTICFLAPLISRGSVASAAAAAAAAGAANANGGDSDDVTRANRGERDRELMQRLGMRALIRWCLQCDFVLALAHWSCYLMHL
jgi:hypothetical protein